jgi:hypothetical protein
MKKTTVLAALIVMLSLVLATTQALASAGAAGVQLPGGTPGGPHFGPTPTGTLMPPYVQGPPPGVKTPGAKATEQAGLHGKPMIYRGTISALGATDMTLTLGDGSSVTIGLTQDTKIMVPDPASQGNTLLVGMQVMALTFPDQNNLPVARMVLVIPGKPLLVHRVGTVTAYTAGSSITIQATDGNSYTFALTGDTKILPAGSTVAVGSRVTIIAPRDPSAVGWTATGIVVQPATSP